MTTASIEPKDRTSRQPPRWRCQLPECAQSNGGEWYEWEGDHAKCPRCGSEPPTVNLMALLHLLIPDPNGMIPSKGRRWSLACHPSREHLATMTNREGATGDLTAVNCPECLRKAEKLGIKRFSGEMFLTGKSGDVLKVGA